MLNFVVEVEVEVNVMLSIFISVPKRYISIRDFFVVHHFCCKKYVQSIEQLRICLKVLQTKVKTILSHRMLLFLSNILKDYVHSQVNFTKCFDKNIYS